MIRLHGGARASRAMTTTNRLHALRRGRLALALVGAMAMPMAPALAQSLPESGSVTSGAATIGSSGTEMTISQSTQGAIIDWGSFNIGAGYGVTFNQPTSGVTLNRVVGSGYGPSASSIDGRLSANGSVFIINAAGITFGSGAVVNVGGLVASTLDIADADFLAGLSSGHYRFTSAGGSAGEVRNHGQLTAADGGTVALIGSYIGNAGTITANLGSVGFGAAQDVTLDFFGDGLTQVTISGNGLSKSNCAVNCAGGINSSGNVFARGGHIELRTNTVDGQPAGNALFVDPANGGRIWISGNVSARTDGARRGSIVLDAGMGNIDLGGVAGRTGNVSTVAANAGEDAGTIEIRANQLFTHLCVWTGNQCVNNNQLGFINATAYGAGGNGGTITLAVGRLYHAGWIQAGSAAGSGGLIDINAVNADIYSIISAESAGGQGGTVGITADNLLLHRGQTPWLGGPGTNYSLATLAAFGSTSGGTVNLVAGTFSMVDLGNVAPEDVNLDAAYRPTISVNGFGGDGGSINVATSSFSLSPWQYFEAIGTGVGGNIDITADAIDLAGGLVATGGTAWGTVTTTATGSLFADATAYIKAGTWQVHAPSAMIVPAAGAVPGSGAVLTDAALGSTLDGGTTVRIFADAALASGASGDIHVGDGVSIVHESDDDATLELLATGGIYGSGFGIESSGDGALDMQFSANVDGDDPDDGFVSFHDFALASNGGSIAMDGNGSGVYLEYGDISSAGGDIHFTGLGDGVGVYLMRTQVSSGDGDIVLEGTATRIGDYPFGVALAGSSLASTGGDISVAGTAEGGMGIQFWSVYDSGTASYVYSTITTGSGAITLDSTGLRGLGLDGIALATDTGDIHLSGTALDDYTTAAVFVSGDITTNGGDITITGTGGSTGVWLYQGDLASNGGDISIDGEGFHYGVQAWDNLVSSGGGDISVSGIATGSDSTGMNVRDAAFAATSGSISLAGEAEFGMGVFFGGDGYGPGSSVTTTSGAISVASSGLYGLDVGDVPFTTDTGDISLSGTALGDDVGVYIGAGGLTTNGGDISITGYGNYGGVVVEGGNIISNGGDIVLAGEGGEFASAGVVLGDAGLHSGGGDIVLSGSAIYGGVDILEDSLLDSAGGDISVSGTADHGSSGGVYVWDSAIHSDGGDIALAGMQVHGGNGNAGLRMQGADVDAGAGLVSLQAGTGDGVGDAILLEDSEVASTTAINLRPVDAGDTILLGAGNGFSLTGAELAMLDAPLLVIGSASHAGAIRVAEAVDRDGDLTLQNQGGSGGIDLQAAVDVGDHTLALASGGDIVQDAAGAITAHSLLAIADGDVSLIVAENDVAANSVAGSAGGDFAYEDIDDLAIGEVSSRGYGLDGSVAGLVGLSASGIAAGGDVLVRAASGNLVLGADVVGAGIDLVAAETFQNPAGAIVSASDGWRIWARTWEGETRGGLQGDGPFDVFGCGFGGDCTGIGGGNRFIYLEQRFIQSPLAPEAVAEWMDDEQWSGGAQDALQAAICPVGDFAGDSLKQGSDSDELARQWLKSRHRLRLSNCIDSKSAPGCRF